MGCDRAKVQILLERIRNELVYDEDKRVLDEWINRLRTLTWAEIEKEIFCV